MVRGFSQWNLREGLLGQLYLRALWRPIRCDRAATCALRHLRRRARGCLLEGTAVDDARGFALRPPQRHSATRTKPYRDPYGTALRHRTAGAPGLTLIYCGGH